MRHEDAKRLLEKFERARSAAAWMEKYGDKAEMCVANDSRFAAGCDGHDAAFDLLTEAAKEVRGDLIKRALELARIDMEEARNGIGEHLKQ